MKVIFNSSLPRSGSQLLQNILAQNPRFHCSGTSGVLELLYAARKNFTELDEFKLSGDPKLSKDCWLSFCKRGLEGWYEATGKTVCVDKSRGWKYYYEWLSAFYPNPKILCCVRDVRAIISSMEKLHRKNMHLHDPADVPAKMQMVDVGSRVQQWLGSPPVGLGLARLRDAILKKNSDNFCFVQYQDLIQNPLKVMMRVYDYIGEQYFAHDFNHVEQLIQENDALHGVYGDHTIKPAVEAPKTYADWDSILGPQICQQIEAQFGWVTKL